MLNVSPVLIKNQYVNNTLKNKDISKSSNFKGQSVDSSKNLHSYYSYFPNIKTNSVSFRGSEKGERIVKDIEYEDYIKFTPEEKEELRAKYDQFYELIDPYQLFVFRIPKTSVLPLKNKHDIADFVKVSSNYNDYRNNKIICVGRSPKWFLNTSIWMKGGIEDYSLAAFSSNWYHRDMMGLGPKLYRDDKEAPTDEQANAYRRYMHRIKCDPVSLVKRVQKTGRPIIITDYIHSGAGLTSYLDLMSKFAEDAGVLDDFAKSIELFTIGSMEYLDDLGYNNWFSIPRVLLPERLEPYSKDIPQHFHDMSASVLRSILVDKNTNECRSTYFPPSAWTVYNPMKYRTGLISEERLKEMPRVKDGVVNNYTNAMKDYRNLMNFRILDYLYTNGLLKEKHKTR